MALRKTPLINNQYYHIYNRTIDHRNVFINKKVPERAVMALKYYQFSNLTVKLSSFLSYSNEKKQEYFKNIETHNKKLIEIIAYCLMPNHFHLLLRQLENNGISKFLANFQNSVTHYYNTKYNRKGHLFEGQFKAVRIESEEQLLHTHRYIHINPATSYVVNDFNDLLNYPWSSLSEYLSNTQNICSKDIILSKFKDVESYKKNIFNQIDYQRKLHLIKHLLIEKEDFIKHN